MIYEIMKTILIFRKIMGKLQIIWGNRQFKKKSWIVQFSSDFKLVGLKLFKRPNNFIKFTRKVILGQKRVKNIYHN